MDQGGFNGLSLFIDCRQMGNQTLRIRRGYSDRANFPRFFSSSLHIGGYGATKAIVPVFLDGQTWEIALRSLIVSSLATPACYGAGPFGGGSSASHMDGWHRRSESVLAAFMALPAVVIGLLGLIFLPPPCLTGRRLP